MATPWRDEVKSRKQLSVFPTRALTSGSWARVFEKALAEFNSLSQTLKLGVTVTRSKTAPDPDGEGGADVQFGVANNDASFVFQGQTFNPKVSGKSLIGHTSIMSIAFPKVPPVVYKSFIFVPATPMASFNKRVVGDPVKLVMAVHELVHCCGLDEADHSPPGDGDILFGFPGLRTGNTPSDDRLEVSQGGVTKLMPPIFMTARTQLLIQKNWQ